MFSFIFRAEHVFIGFYLVGFVGTMIANKLGVHVPNVPAEYRYVAVCGLEAVILAAIVVLGERVFVERYRRSIA